MFEAIVRRGILTAVVTLIVCMLGLLAATRIPVQMIPDLDVRTVSISTSWPGATAQDVEKEILIEQEDYLRNLPNLSRIESSATRGRAEIELEFPFATDITEMLIRVNNALSQVPDYPEAVDEPVIYASSFSSNAFMFIHLGPLPGNPRDLDMDLLLDYVEDNVKSRLSRVPGVSDVQISGSAERQVQILIDPARLSQRQLSIVDVRNAIRERNRDRSAGGLDEGKRQYLIRTIGRFRTLDELRDLVLVRRENTVIRLRDVADVRLDHFELQGNSLFNGEASVQLRIFREPGSNVIGIKNAVLAEIEAMNAQFLNDAGLVIQEIANDATYVEDSIANVWTNLALGSALATVVMFVFVRSPGKTLIGVMGIPICIIMAFLGMLVFGRTINVISLAGIAFAIGMTLDNSIVVMESIALQRDRGLGRFEAATRGVREVWPAVFASTMTTVLVFIPITFVEQESGQLYSDIAIAISSAIIASMLVAITVLPTASARLPEKGGQLLTATRPWGAATLLRLLDRMLETSRRRVGAVLSAIVLSTAIIVWMTPPAEYLPEGEEPKIFSVLTPPRGYNNDTVLALLERVQDELTPHIGADPDDYHEGRAAVPALKYINMRSSSRGMLTITEPVDSSDIEALMESLERIYAGYPGTRHFVSRGSIISSNEGGTRSINLDISGSELSEIFRVAESAYQRAVEVFGTPRIQTTPGSLSLDQPMIEILPDWVRAAEVGIAGDELGYTIAALTDGSFADEFFFGDDKIDIYLYSKAGQQAQLDTLPDLPIFTRDGRIVPLGSIAAIREGVDTDSIRRVNGNRTVTLNIIPPSGVALETGVEQMRREVIGHLRDAGEIPAHVSIDISGAADQLEATREALSGNYLVALLIIYLLLTAIFSNWLYPLLIITTIPLGIAGGILGLWTLNLVGGWLPVIGLGAIAQPLDMISMLGFLILMGTVVNNPILIVDRTLGNWRDEGMSPIDAVREAVETRLRPIAMSTVTTLAGLAPLVFIPGAGVELYRGVGIIVMFGLIGATAVSVTVLPALIVTCLEVVTRWRLRPAS